MEEGRWQKSQSEWARQKEAPWIFAKDNCQNQQYIDPNRKKGDPATRTCHACHKASRAGQEANEKQAQEESRPDMTQRCPKSQCGGLEAASQFMKEVGR